MSICWGSEICIFLETNWRVRSCLRFKELQVSEVSVIMFLRPLYTVTQPAVILATPISLVSSENPTILRQTGVFKRRPPWFSDYHLSEGFSEGEKKHN